MTNEQTNARAEVIVAGRVQGVGFRAWVKTVARARSLTGEVLNQADGTVKIILEGNERLINEVVDLCKQGPLTARVDRTDVAFKQYTGKHQEFRITY